MLNCLVLSTSCCRKGHSRSHWRTHRLIGQKMKKNEKEDVDVIATDPLMRFTLFPSFSWLNVAKVFILLLSKHKVLLHPNSCHQEKQSELFQGFLLQQHCELGPPANLSCFRELTMQQREISVHLGRSMLLSASKSNQKKAVLATTNWTRVEELQIAVCIEKTVCGQDESPSPSDPVQVAWQFLQHIHPLAKQ